MCKGVCGARRAGVWARALWDIRVERWWREKPQGYSRIGREAAVSGAEGFQSRPRAGEAGESRAEICPWLGIRVRWFLGENGCHGELMPSAFFESREHRRERGCRGK